jgi:nuclease S1
MTVAVLRMTRDLHFEGLATKRGPRALSERKMLMFGRIGPSSAIAVTLLLFVAIQPTYGWGARGHRIATRIAQDRLSPKAAAAVRELLNEGDTLVGIANWADHEGHDVVPASAPWHYVNIPITERRYDARFCGRNGCVVSKIHHYRKVLADRRAPRRERQLALLFLVHLVEDVHQPLHVGDNHDRGGNSTQVQFLREGTNLHRLWDSGVIDHTGTERVLADRVTARINAERVKEWSRGDVEDWATESLLLAQRAYFFPKGARQPIVSGTRLGEEYERLALPLIEDRLAQAGIRLANELNAIFP